ncbi:hypothetical protein N0X72_23765 [Streptomyces carpaticus]|uniref:Uncharacterized protein n=2 Tax=Streptomyces TaxID=1883 RepID=A0A1I6PV01_9ACTN|nr:MULTISPECIES: hypothetical protein [Streptomyces]MCK1812985.1 hypothetical protein [Streptomyces sp. XM4011]QKV71337.1 hypothetical protein HUT13_23140 [Streptomyces harbinensis]UWM51779.1 hypothetical protein N0X72_23765 [Streptomyces carpaticus]SFS44043.1 hypothetical protein SAMN05444716_101742 [Streptomyces harbinensis]
MNQTTSRTTTDRATGRTMDHRAARWTLVLFAVTGLLALAVSPFTALYGLLLGAGGLVATGLLARRHDSTGTTAATVVFAGLLAGSLPYLLAGAFLP